MKLAGAAFTWEKFRDLRDLKEEPAPGRSTQEPCSLTKLIMMLHGNGYKEIGDEIQHHGYLASAMTL